MPNNRAPILAMAVVVVVVHSELPAAEHCLMR
jgi:hypothetical protein